MTRLLVLATVLGFFASASFAQGAIQTAPPGAMDASSAPRKMHKKPGMKAKAASPTASDAALGKK